MGNKRKCNSKRKNYEHKKQGVEKLQRVFGISTLKNGVNWLIAELKKVSLSDKINMVMTFLTFLSVVGVFVTLNEMKLQRDTSYAPSIVMNPVEVSFEWDEFGNETWLSTENDMNRNITDTVSIEILQEVFTKYSVVNVGVGTAKNIVFKWDEDNTKNLYDYLVSCNPEMVNFCEIGENSDVFDINDRLLMVSKEGKVELMYMLPEAEETYSLYFPQQYTLLINEAIKSGYMNEYVNPFLLLNVAYHDIQGKLRQEVIIIRIKRMMYQLNEDGSGSAYYQLIPAFPSDVIE